MQVYSSERQQRLVGKLFPLTREGLPTGVRPLSGTHLHLPLLEESKTAAFFTIDMVLDSPIFYLLRWWVCYNKKKIRVKENRL